MNTIEKRSLSLNALSVSLLFALLTASSLQALTLEGVVWHDIGEVHNARVLQHVFSLKNNAETACVIERVTPDCMTCTRVEISQSYVAPGETVQLTALLATASLEGAMSKGIRVELDGARADLYFGFRGTVIPRFEHDAAEGQISSIQAGEVFKAEYQLRDAQGKDWARAECHNSLTWMQGQVTGFSEGRFALNLHCDTQSYSIESGFYQGIQTLALGEDRVELLIPLLIENDYVISPKKLLFRKSNEEQKQQLFYKANSPKLLIKAVHLESEHFRAVVRPEYSPGEYRIYVYGKGLEGYNESRDVMRIETVDETAREVLIPLLIRP